MDDKIIRFDLLHIDKNSRKLCECDKLKYTIDQENRLIKCDLCGAYLDPFEVFSRIIDKFDEFVKIQENQLRKIKSYKEEILKYDGKLIKYTLFRNMQSNYSKDLFPVCPKCNEMFDPRDITNWQNKNYI